MNFFWSIIVHLKKLLNPISRPGPLLLIIMDGIGIGKQDETNAVFLAKKPHLDHYFKTGLYTTLRAHGTAVGLPSDDDMGNSEVGHNALGSGRIVDQGAKLVNAAIESDQMFQSDIWQKIVQNVKNNHTTLHFIGLLSDGNVHSHIQHLFAMLKKAQQEKVAHVRIHPLLDGRDVGEKTALIYIEQLETLLAKINQAGFDYQIASGGGRMVTTMDRYFADWNIVKRGWNAHVLGKGRQFSSASQAITTYYQEDPKITDQYLPEFVIAKDGKPVGKIVDQDSVIFFNFRGDRAIEISMAFEQEQFTYFDREYFPKTLYAGMMQYDGDLALPKNYLVSPPQIKNTISEYLCEENIYSFAISETQKFGHVTYFWNGNKSGYVCEKLEKYIEIPSDKITFDKAPKMKAPEITDATIDLLKSGKYQFGRVNFANGDMVGHTGILPAAITAVETVDTCVGRLVETVQKMNGIVVITADHGNADEMFKTAHTLNPVPFVIVDSNYQNEYHLSNTPKAGLANIAATLINLLGYEPPKDYQPSLITTLFHEVKTVPSSL